jgi:hypothetical protein
MKAKELGISPRCVNYGTSREIKQLYIDSPRVDLGIYLYTNTSEYALLILVCGYYFIILVLLRYD